jgi:hypothetical protein
VPTPEFVASSGNHGGSGTECRPVFGRVLQKPPFIYAIARIQGRFERQKQKEGAGQMNAQTPRHTEQKTAATERRRENFAYLLCGAQQMGESQILAAPQFRGAIRLQFLTY